MEVDMTRRANRSTTGTRRHARRRGLTLGTAVPAVVAIGALPAFAEHSGVLDDEVDGLLEDPEVTGLTDEFTDASLVDPDDDITEAGFYEEAYDPYAEQDGSEGDGDSEDEGAAVG